MKGKLKPSILGFLAILCLANFFLGIKLNYPPYENELAILTSANGDWDWSKSTPEGIEVIKTIRNPWGEPILYLVKSSQSKKQ